MINIINELNLENGSNYKMGILKKYKDNELLKRVLKMGYDKVSYSYGITMKNVPHVIPFGNMSLEWALDILESRLCTRETTGNNAIDLLYSTLSSLSPDDATVLEMIINRDLRINMGTANINKIFPKLITKPPYMRCSLKDKLNKIKYPAISDLKEDGTYRSVIVNNENIITMSRSGEQDNFIKFQEKIKNLPNGVYIGEFLIESLPGKDNRLKANGLINSDTEQDDMYFSCWDYLTLEEFANGKSDVDYIKRRSTLKDNLTSCNTHGATKSVESKLVNSYEEAMEHYKQLVEFGFEGTVLKNTDTKFKDGTSTTQIKIKEEAVAEFIVTGYQEGEGRLSGMLGAMYYESSDGLVKGKMSGFSDDIRKEIWYNQQKYMNSIVSVKYNGVTQAKGSDTYSLMFANFIEFRPEKDIADNLEYIQNALK